MRLNSAMGNRFNATPSVKAPRSQFDLSRRYKTTFDGGKLVPFLLMEVMPGDTFNCRTNGFFRLATPLKPIMDTIKLTTFYFYSPNRLLWSNFQKFMGEQESPGDSISYTIPQVVMPAGGPTPAGAYELWNYLGVPAGTQITGSFSISALPSRMYNRVYRDWFKDENLQNAPQLDTGDSADNKDNYPLRRRGKRFDYFTSCLTAPQKGSAVTIPVGAQTAPVNLIPYTTTNNANLMKVATTDALLSAGRTFTTDANGKLVDNVPENVVIDPNGRWQADLSSALATSINSLRLAEMTQVFLERNARGGTRYIEIIRSQFGVVSDDARLQRTEYLGGGSSEINTHPVPLTTKGDGTSTGAQGNLAAYGTGSVENHGFNKSFTEHGYIMGIMHVGIDLTYQQGLERHWSRSTRLDYPWPVFANIGEQAVYMKELYLQGDAAGANHDNNVFGYQERYAEMRYGMSLITGKFASTYATPLDMWHGSQKFTSEPSLGDTFIQDTPPFDRLIAVTTEPHFLCDIYHKVTVGRVLPVYGIPGLGQRF